MNREIISYSNAIYDMALSQNKVEMVYKELCSLQKLLEEQKYLKRFFLAPIYAIERKIRVLGSLASSLSCSLEVKNFMSLLLRYKKFSLLDDIIVQYNKKHNENSDLYDAVLITAKPMDSQELDAIHKILSKKIGLQFSFEHKIDPKIFGGAILKYKSVMIDASIAGQLKLIQQRSKKILQYTD